MQENPNPTPTQEAAPVAAPAPEQAVEPTPTTAPTPTPEPAPAQPKSKKNLIIIAGAIVAVVIIAIVIAVILMNQKPASQAPAADSGEQPAAETKVYKLTDIDKIYEAIDGITSVTELKATALKTNPDAVVNLDEDHGTIRFKEDDPESIYFEFAGDHVTSISLEYLWEDSTLNVAKDPDTGKYNVFDGGQELEFDNRADAIQAYLKGWAEE